MDCRQLKRFLTHFQVEVFVFFFIISVAVDDVTVTLMAQEKICMARFNTTNLCSNLSRFEQLPEFPERSEYIRQKDIILAEVTQFTFYQQVINTVPVLVTSMFLSTWADKHPNSSKILLTLSSIMSILESATMFVCAVFFNSNVYLMLISSVYFPLAGGNQGFIMAIMSYLSSTTKATSRVKRFSMLEFTFIVAFPAGVFIGGQIVNSPYLTDFARANGALHNYHTVFIVSIIGKFISLLYVLTMRFKKPRSDCKSPESSLCGNEKEARVNTAPKEDAKLEALETTPLLKKLPETNVNARGRSISTCRVRTISTSDISIFSWRNVVESFEVVLRYRPNGVHIQIWLLIATMSIFVMVARSINVVMFQFVQKLYSWDAGYYSTVNSLFFVTTHLFGLLVIIPLLRKVTSAADITLLLLGLISYMTQNFIRGAVDDVNWFYVSYAIGSITPVIAVASRSQLAKLAPLNELNRIFGVLALLETITPLIGTAIFTQIFSHTISFYPGAAHVTSALILVLPFLFTAFLGIHETRRYKSRVKRKDTNNNPESQSTTSFEESIQTVIFIEAR